MKKYRVCDMCEGGQVYVADVDGVEQEGGCGRRSKEATWRHDLQLAAYDA